MDSSGEGGGGVNGGTDLHMAARTGDVARVAYLLEVLRADVDAHDRWQATPLFYASLCGHVAVLHLLLKAGAKCERLTFDGERCLYAALNDECRDVLVKHGFSRAASRAHDAYLDYLENAYDNADDAHARYRDTRILVDDGAPLDVHACVLAARCPALAARVGKRRRVRLQSFGAAVLAALLRWCYTARLEAHAASLDEMLRLLKHAKLPDLAQRLREEAAVAPAGQQRVVVEPPRKEAKEELVAALAQLLAVAQDEDEATAEQQEALRANAVCFAVDGQRFWAQPSFLAPRSEFFDALLSRWSDNAADENDQLHTLTLHDVSADAFRAMLCWAYTDGVASSMPLPLLIELISCADQFLLDGLKQRAALLLIPHVGPATCVPLLRLAERANADRLGEAAAAAVAEHLESLADDEELETAVRESAATVIGRQAADSIPVLDDISFQVTRLHGGGGDLSDEDEEERWAAPNDASPQERERAAAAMRAGAASERRRKVAMLMQLAAKVQGWSVAAPRALRT